MAESLLNFDQINEYLLYLDHTSESYAWNLVVFKSIWILHAWMTPKKNLIYVDNVTGFFQWETWNFNVEVSLSQHKLHTKERIEG